MAGYEAHDHVTMSIRPRFEGFNIGVWTGFKHVMYLMEEAVLEYFRRNFIPAGSLYQDYGVCLEIAGSEIKLHSGLFMDDEAVVHVQLLDSGGPDLVFSIRMEVERSDGKRVKIASGKVEAALLQAGGASPELRAPLGERLVGSLNRTLRIYDSIQQFNALHHHRQGHVFRKRIPYYYCHYSERLQHSGYLRLMEEAVDLFLEARGISIGSLWRTRGWIPAVTEARLELFQEVGMEETVHAQLTVTDLYKNLLFHSQVDFFVERGGKYVHAAAGFIVHGYADRSTWKLVEFDPAVLRALRGAGEEAAHGQPQP